MHTEGPLSTSGLAFPDPSRSPTSPDATTSRRGGPNQPTFKRDGLIKKVRGFKPLFAAVILTLLLTLTLTLADDHGQRRRRGLAPDMLLHRRRHPHGDAENVHRQTGHHGAPPRSGHVQPHRLPQPAPHRYGRGWEESFCVRILSLLTPTNQILIMILMRM